MIEEIPKESKYTTRDFCEELNDLMELSIPKIGMVDAVIMLCTFAEASLKRMKQIEAQNERS
jgi:hypothetical protein